jgi:hypothetical protein
MHPFAFRDFTDHTDFRLTIAHHRAQSEFLLGNQLFQGDNARAVQAQHHRLGDFREDSALGIGADQENRNLLGYASATTIPLVGHLGNLGKGPRVLLLS